MKALKQTLKVKNHQVVITLPDDFNSDEVEVIILSTEDDFILTGEQKAILNERSKEPAENYISAEESLKRLKNKT